MKIGERVLHLHSDVRPDLENGKNHRLKEQDY